MQRREFLADIHFMISMKLDLIYELGLQGYKFAY